jgi:hypothetical protein
MSATAIPKIDSFADAIREAAPLADELLEVCNNKGVGIIIIAMMVAQISLAEDHGVSKKEFDNMLNTLWTHWKVYHAKKNAAH